MALRARVLCAFKELHKARKIAFKDDSVALEASKQKIRDEFRKNKNEIDAKKIQKLAQTAEDAAIILRKLVVQGVLTEEGNYRLRITDETILRKNAEIPATCNQSTSI